MGNATPSVVLGAVSLLPSEPRAATRRSARNDAVVGWRPAFALRVSHGPSSARRRAWPVRTRRMSPVSTAHPLVALRRLEIFAEHVLARLDPRNAAYSRHVEQDAAADQSVLEDLDRTGPGALRGHRLSGFPSNNAPSKATWQKASMWLCPSLW